MNFSSSLHLVDFVIIALYLVVLLGIGFFTGRTASRTGEDLFLGGRNLRWPSIGLSIFSTNVSPNMLIGLFGIAYATGVVASNFEWLAWIFLMLLAMVFVPHYLTTRISTMPEFLLNRYNARCHRFLSYFNLFTTLVVWLGVSLFAGSIVISQVLGLPVWMSALVIAAIATSYTAVGGLAAVVRTDLFQSVLIITATTIIAILAFLKVGGLTNLMANTPDTFWQLFRPIDDPVYPWHAILLGYPVIGIWYWCTDQTIVQRVLAAKNTREGQYGAFFTAFLKIFIPVIFLFPGIICYVLYPGLPNPDHAYMTMVMELLPTGFVGLVVAALLAALINTIAAGLNSFSTIFTLDIYARKINPGAPPPTVKRVGQWVIALAAVGAVLFAILFENASKNIFDLSQGIGSFIAPPLATVFLLGVLWKKATPRAAEWTLVGGSVLSLALGFLHILDYPNAGFWPHYMLMSFYIFAGLFLFMVLASLATQPEQAPEATTLFATLRQQGYRQPKGIWYLWGALGLVMMGIYIILN